MKLTRTQTEATEEVSLSSLNSNKFALSVVTTFSFSVYLLTRTCRHRFERHVQMICFEFYKNCDPCQAWRQRQDEAKLSRTEMAPICGCTWGIILTSLTVRFTSGPHETLHLRLVSTK